MASSSNQRQYIGSIAQSFATLSAHNPRSVSIIQNDISPNLISWKTSPLDYAQEHRLQLISYTPLL